MSLIFQSKLGMSDDDPQLSEINITDGQHTCIAICPTQLCNSALHISLPLLIVLDGKVLPAPGKEVQIKQITLSSQISPQAKAKHLGTCLEVIGTVKNQSEALIEVGGFQFKVIGGIPKDTNQGDKILLYASPPDLYPRTDLRFTIKILTWCSVLFAGWALSRNIQGEQTLTLSLIITPWMILFLWRFFRPHLRLENEILRQRHLGGPQRERLNFFTAFFLMGMFIAVNARDYRLIHHIQMISPVILMGCSLVYAIDSVYRKFLRKVPLLFAITLTGALFYGYGATLLLNGLSVFAPYHQSESKILGKEHKRVSNGRSSYLRYYLSVTPWGPRNQETQPIEVSNLDYDSLQVGDMIKIYSWKGKLGIEWYTYSP